MRKIKLGYYYHVCALRKDNKVFLPSYLAVFFDELANQVDNLFLFLYEAKTTSQISSADYPISAPNITWINMGSKETAWYRAIFANQIISNKIKDFNSLDALIIRSPTPLAPYFSNFKSLNKKLVFMIVSDYKKGAEMIPQNSFRNFLVKSFVLWNDRIFKKSLKDKLLIVNSKEIYDDHKHLSNFIYEIKTTTLRNSDFYVRDNQKLVSPIKLLFTGRFVLQKGLIELFEAVSQLNKDNIITELHLVGWEKSDEKPFENKLKVYAKSLNIESKIIFHGLKAVGDELNAMYRMADIYVLPSHHEGFPRTIWEAMANSLPVITTTVGAIPAYLKNQIHALLVPPRDSQSLFNAIKFLIKNEKHRLVLVDNAKKLVSNNTLENQTKDLIDLINKKLL